MYPLNNYFYLLIYFIFIILKLINYKFMDNFNNKITNTLYNRNNYSENIQFSIDLKVLKESISKQKELTEKILENNLKVTPKSINSTFEYKV